MKAGGFRLLEKRTIGMKMTLISLVGLVGFLTIAGIGYWASTFLSRSAQSVFLAQIQTRQQLAESADHALTLEAQVQALGKLNAGLISLQQAVVDGSNLRSKGITVEEIMGQAAALVRQAEVVREMPGADRAIPGTNGITLADQIIGNFSDVQVLLEYELPDLFALEPGTPEFVGRQGSMLVSMAKMYFFISRTLGELSENIHQGAARAQADFTRVSEEADRLTATAQASLASASGKAQNGLWIALLATVAVLFPLFVWFIVSMIKILKRTVAMAEDLGKGRVSARLEVGARRDEFADMARALNAFADNLEHEVVAALQAMAHGDLDIEVHPVDDQDQLRGALQKMAEDMNGLLGQVQGAAEQFTASSGQVAEASQALSQGATESASSLEEISASMTQLAAQTTQNAENATNANQLTSQAQGAADRGNEQMKQMVAAMAEIQQAGQNISRIIKTIDEIAFQTNLLALNAAVEAARAGQHGKGFAVVAEEVRSLAARSAAAAKETAELIAGSVKKTEAGSRIAGGTAAGFEEIVGMVTRISGLVAEIAEASRDQATGLGEINQGLGQIDQVTQQNTAYAETSAAAAQELSGQAAQLGQMLHRFKLKGQVGGEITKQAPAKPSPKQEAISWSSMAEAEPKAAPKRHPETFIALEDQEFGRY
ncbi:hypothetical protein DESUT3_36000 [Desulfuromonas versatilis]|uniref:Methyl-accepting chemotaxis sensory transducer n=1 Tax=Desulfuromonas versatilis TaxID=2802975 RepID=A0ABM8I0L6_9BACT|nr:HAMP domain-containing methyl-accepting chemotaxis protein [Desulfuromonas versatilis]BCR06531.1 hypothetical protein DESUT3_36000 [Desulfuromonas versatilis]